MNLTIDDLIKEVSAYNIEGLDEIKKAYEYASLLHGNQKRESGEPYIIHPLSVAFILSELHADKDTICAALLHDTIEDTGVNREDIKQNFNEEVAKLVDGVTKISNLNFSTKADQYYANTRKIIVGTIEDVRIILIKLADRLHNMRTLEYKKPFKQKENSIETLDIFVPLAYYTGAYRIKTELEDLSFSYLYPEKYKKLQEELIEIEKKSAPYLSEMSEKIGSVLSSKNKNHEIKMRTKNVYGYNKIKQSNEGIVEAHDLLSLKIMVDGITDCYETLGIVHSQYKNVNNLFKDYIFNPKTNMYRSLHTTVYGPNNKLVQTQIRTFDMDKVASFGLATYWYLNKTNVSGDMQNSLEKHSQFFKSLVEMDGSLASDKEFVSQVWKEQFTERVFVHTINGDVVSLPTGSTVLDFAYTIPSLGEHIVSAMVNDELVPLNYVLKDDDRIRILTNDLSVEPTEEWLEWARTATAKNKIKQLKFK